MPYDISIARDSFAKTCMNSMVQINTDIFTQKSKRHRGKVQAETMHECFGKEAERAVAKYEACKLGSSCGQKTNLKAVTLLHNTTTCMFLCYTGLNTIAEK